MRLLRVSILLLLAIGSHGAAAIEEPAHTRIVEDGAFELREYAAYLVAETRVEGNFDDAGGRAFRLLFDYISGNNRQRQELAMTAPVVQQNAAADSEGVSIAMTAPVRQEQDGEAWRVAFVVPAGFDQQTVPEPLDARVQIREVPAARVAVWRFSGRWTQAAFTKAEASLREAIGARGLEVVGAVVTARYNAPFTLPFLRRNEVLIPVRERPL